MKLVEREIDLPPAPDGRGLIPYFEASAAERLPQGELPVRFVVTETRPDGYHCELATIAGVDELHGQEPESIFQLAKRPGENADAFNVALLVPTGIGAEIGGHAGDAAPVARLLASACDTLITHPNVVNASDINELPENGLYVEGSVICRLLMGTAGLQPVRANRVLLVIDDHEDSRIAELSINAVSAARASMGLDCPRVVKMRPPVRMRARYTSSGSAAGRVEGLERLLEVLARHRAEYDAVAIATVIGVPMEYHSAYFDSHGEMVNPWGGVEAMLTHAISMVANVPSAHSPMLESVEILNLFPGAVDPRMAAEAVSNAFLHSVLKGLHRAPRIVTDQDALRSPGVVAASDVSCLVIPDGCVGLPTLAAMEQGIPVIAVRENKNRMRNDLTELPFAPGKLFVVDNYLEAVGVMAALKAGVAVPAVRRPIADTLVSLEQSDETGATMIPSKTADFAET